MGANKEVKPEQPVQKPVENNINKADQDVLVAITPGTNPQVLASVLASQLEENTETTRPTKKLAA